MVTQNTRKSNKSSDQFDLIVFSHLRWEFVFQRPQHILSRLSKTHRILFVEENITHESTENGNVKIIKVNKNISILQPRLQTLDAESYGNIVNEQIQKFKLRNYAVWFYSAMFADVLQYLEPSLVIYDCMDELSAFKGAPKELIDKERALLKTADVVFTGGKSLYAAKKKFAKNVYCFPSSVDEEHFTKALKSATKIPPDIKSVPKPIVGYYGVIDERINLDLLRETAAKKPKVSFVMIGPVVKISEEDLPKEPNIIFLGNKDYKRLPSYLKAFDIAMMPFALNESTKFISPTKTPEYMAGMKPVISTPIVDVVKDYKEEVTIVKNPAQFAKAIDHYLNETTALRKKRESLFKAVLKKTSWNKTVAEMEKIIKIELHGKA